MAAIALPSISREEYLRRERLAQERSEYHKGHVVTMAGASRKHNRIVSNITGSLVAQLKGRRCNNYANDMRVAVRGGEFYLYPDVVVTCGPELYEDDEDDILLNPILILEVLSESTEAYDRGEKFLSYPSIPTLREYVMVSQTPPRFEFYHKQEDGSWVYRSWSEAIPPLSLQSIGCTLLAVEVYDKLEDVPRSDPAI
ncbi:MAG: Uma2 family endonuclease [Isosphaeraceae bacterium]|nr:Uma2 family endonuclease [Isosphaeraceae bacterium]